MIELKKPALPTITNLMIKVGNQCNLGNFNLFKQEITATVELLEGQDPAEIIRATQLRLAKALINKETAAQISNEVKDGFK